MNDVNMNVVEKRLTIHQWMRIVHFMGEQNRPLYVAEIAKRKGFSQFTIQGIMSSLRIKGLVRNRRHDTNKRKKLYSLTEKGIEIYVHIQQIFNIIELK